MELNASTEYLGRTQRLRCLQRLFSSVCKKSPAISGRAPLSQGKGADQSIGSRQDSTARTLKMLESKS
jgi:hypothetical protein